MLLSFVHRGDLLIEMFTIEHTSILGSVPQSQTRFGRMGNFLGGLAQEMGKRR